MGAPFADRRAAGRALAEAVGARIEIGDDEDVIVLALPRGGVPVAYEVAGGLRADLDVFVVRKVGVPGHEELAMGAVAPAGTVVLNDNVVSAVGVDPARLQRAVDDATRELERRQRAYRAGRAAPRLAGRTVVLVDDGLATGATMRAAVEAVRHAEPRRVIVAVPVASPSTVAALQHVADDVIVVTTPAGLGAVGQAYVDFTQTTDDEVRDLLSAL